MNPELETVLLARYKALCELVDNYRERGMFDDADKLIHSEMKIVLEALLGEGKKIEPQGDNHPAAESAPQEQEKL